MEVLRRDLLDRSEIIHTRIVDQDVKTSERLLRFREKTGDLRLVRAVCPDRYRFAPITLDLGDDPVCARLAARVVDDDRRPGGGEMLRDRSTDSL